MSDISFLVTGGSSGSGLDLVNALGSSATGLGRANGFDISSVESRRKIVELSLSSDVFVNHACSSNPFSQVLLLEEIFEAWKTAEHKGYIISTGSYSTYSMKPTMSLYSAAKFALDTYSRQCSKWCENHPGTFRVSVIRPGIIDSERSRAKPHWPGHGIEMKNYAALIRFLVSQPSELIFPDLVLSSRANQA